jgi:hypothetical protein
VLPIPKETMFRAGSLFEIEGLAPAVRLVVASTHEREEELVAKALVLRKKRRQARNAAHLANGRLSTVMVPRHPKRVNALANNIRRKFGLPVRVVPVSFILNGRSSSDSAGSDSAGRHVSTSKHSWGKNGEASSDDACITLVEGVGALRALYASADIALVGGALLEGDEMVGQHNVVEPLQHACITLHGAHARDDGTFCSLWKSFLTHGVAESELGSVLRALRGSEAEDVYRALEQVCGDVQGDTCMLERMHATMTRVARSSSGLDGHWTELERGRFFGRVLG